MNCQEVRELLPLYLDGELENYQKESVSRHLDGCPECRRRLELDRRLTGSLARLARPTVAARVPATLKPRVMAKVGNRQRWQPFWRAARVLASGTTLVIWIGLVGLLLVAIATMARDMPGIAAKPPLAPQTTGVAAPSPAAATAAAARAPVALLSLKMVDTTTGWAVSNRAILRITDGSSHWTSVTPPAILLRSYAPPSGEAFAGQYFLDADNAWVVAAPAPGATGGLLLHTTDGGRTWQNLNLPAATGQLTFVDRQRGWLMASQGVAAGSQAVDVYRTQDGGAHWDLVASAKPDAQQTGTLPFGGLKSGLAFKDVDNGWAAGTTYAPGAVWFYASHDGGRTWQKQALAVPTEYKDSEATAEAPRFFGTQDGIMAVRYPTPKGMALVLYLTRDGGASWFNTTPLVGIRVYAFADVVNGWAIAVSPSGEGVSLYRTTDGGKKWTLVSGDHALAQVNGLAFVGDKVGWAYGGEAQAPFLLKTTDSGQTWQDLSPAVSGPAPLDTPAAAPTPAKSVPACTASELSATVGWQGATGSMAGSVVLTNVGNRSCTLDGPADIQFVDASGTSLPVTQSEMAAGSAQPVGATPLRPGEQASVFFVWRNYCGPQPNGSLTTRVTLPNGGGRLVAQPDGPNADKGLLPRCDVPGTASTVSVGPFSLVNPPTPTPTPIPTPAPPAKTDQSRTAGAVQTLLDYFGAVNQSGAANPEQYRRAYNYWAGGGAASGQTLAQFSQGYANTVRVSVLLGEPAEKPLGGAGAGVFVPVTLQAVVNEANGSQRLRYFAGTYVLQPAAGAAGWEIASASVNEIEGGGQPLAGTGDSTTVLRSYFDAINAKQYARAYTLWNGLGLSSGQTFAEFLQGYANTYRVDVDMGVPLNQGAAGSIYADVPVVVYATQNDRKTTLAFCGTYTARHLNVPPFDRFGWHIEGANIAPTASVQPGSVEEKRLLAGACTP